MKILVTGGTVFASRYTAEYFGSRGHDVYVLNRGNDPHQPENTKLIRCDRHALGNTLKEHHFDAVLDVTAYNAVDVKDLHDALGDFGTYIFVSSSAVYPETLPQPFNESQKCGENVIWGRYGTDKLSAEEYIKENIEDHYIIRPPYLYGPMNNLYREAFVFECAENDCPFYIPSDGKMPLQFFYIGDMCRFMEILLDKKPDHRIYNVGNTETVDINEWVRLCYKVLGKEPEIRYVSRDIPQRSYFPFYDYAYILDTARQSGLMQELTPLCDGLCASYEWYREHRQFVRKKPLIGFIDENFR